MKLPTQAVLWIRRDFRSVDQAALYHATRLHSSVLPVFVLDPRKLEEFSPGQKPAAYFFGTLLKFRDELRRHGKDLLLLEGDPIRLIPDLCRKVGAQAIFFNKDYEPSSLERDREVTLRCEGASIQVHSFKDHVLHEEGEILNGSGKSYRVFSAYRNAVFKRLGNRTIETWGTPKWESLALTEGSKLSKECSSLWEKIERMGDASQGLGTRSAKTRLARFVEGGVSRYSVLRNLPAEHGTSRLSADLRSGAISPRLIWNAVIEAQGVRRTEKETFLSELLWRDFFMMIGFHFPHVFQGNYSERYDAIRWRNSKSDFQAWREGRTGYPIVDAGMRELAETGFMHNRVRMITAMFLVKDLLVDWRWGERYFREQLVDGDLAVNNGNWQWCASTGCDAQPYFRIFNPTRQGKRFDPEGEYIRRWVPELRGLSSKQIHEPWAGKRTSGVNYPHPIVDHSGASMRCLIAYRSALGSKSNS